MNALLPSSWVIIPCPECGTEGCIEVDEPCGYYDMRQECWYPRQRYIPCPKCNGMGALEVTFDPQPLDLREAA